MRYLKPLVPVALLIVFAGAARAEAMVVSLDHASRLDVRGAANVVVGNDKIADVTVVDSQTVYVVGKAYGSTNIVVSDRNGRTLFAGDVTVTPPATTVAVYRGADRTEVACATSCAPGEHPAQAASGGANPVFQLTMPPPARAGGAAPPSN